MRGTTANYQVIPLCPRKCCLESNFPSTLNAGTPSPPLPKTMNFETYVEFSAEYTASPPATPPDRLLPWERSALEGAITLGLIRALQPKAKCAGPSKPVWVTFKRPDRRTEVLRYTNPSVNQLCRNQSHLPRSWLPAGRSRMNPCFSYRACTSMWAATSSPIFIKKYIDLSPQYEYLHWQSHRRPSTEVK